MKKIIIALASGVKSSAFSAIYKSLIQIIQLIILTRILSHEEFGIFAIVSIFINFAKIYMDFGVTNSIIQERNPSHTLLSSLFWINALSGLIISILVYVVSTPISYYYDAEVVSHVMKYMSVVFFTYSLSNLHRALMKKYFDFVKLAFVDCFSLTISFLTTIIAAYIGEGVWSFAYGAIIHSVVSTLSIILLSKRYLIPSFEFDFKASISSIKFGLFQLGQNTTIFATTQVDVIIIGKLLGLEILGVYNILKQYLYMLSQVVNPIIGNVVYPILSSINDDESKVDNLSIKILQYTFILNVSFFGLFVVFPEFICDVVLDTPGYSNVLVILAIFFAMRSFLSPLGVLLLSKGKANVAFYWSLMEFISISVFCFIGAQYSIYGLSKSLLIHQVMMIILSWFFLVSRYTTIGIIEYIRYFIVPCLVFCLTYISTLVISQLPINHNLLLPLLIFGYFMGYVIFSIMFNFEIIKFFKNRVGNDL
jgi:O-antigen/teichoic acid export membrane protein